MNKQASIPTQSIENPSSITASGRPSSLTPEKSAKLLIALEYGLNLKESLQLAGISDDAYRRRLKKDPEFRGQITASEMKLIIVAKLSIAKKIYEGDVKTSRWYLERKCPEEFGRHSKSQEEMRNHEHLTMILPGGEHVHALHVKD